VTGTPRQPSLRAREKAIAEQFIGGFPWPMVLWALSNTTIWLALWPLVMTGLIPLWLGFIVAIVNIALSYLPSHDAQHDIIFPHGSHHHWFNEFIGYYSLIPLATPLSVLRVTHLEHHRHTNDPLLDPDFHMNASSVREALWKAITKNQPRNDRYGAALQRLGTPAAKRAIIEAVTAKVLFCGILVGLAWSGWALEAALLWWLPRQIAGTYINFFLSWAPHYPNPEQGRYRNTRAFISRLGNLGSSGMQYHIVHHLYPTIPLYRNPAAFRALRPILEEQGCELGGLKR
jgi:beta-carotene hydroxylase